MNTRKPIQTKGMTIDGLPEAVDIKREKACRHLRTFVPYVWEGVMPAGTEYVPGWHIDVMCDHLEAISRGEMQRLVINVPPRHMKSLLTSVFWPAWEWLHDPVLHFLTSSYSEDLSLRDSVRMRRLVQSEQYFELMQHRQKFDATFQPFDVREGTGEKKYWENTAGGQRIATSVLGRLTGLDGDRIIVDDPHNVVEQESQTRRKNVVTWFDESLSSRIINPRTCGFVVIMQRLHEEDLTGHLLSIDEEDDESEKWDHLCLPGFYEPDVVRGCTSLNFTDPRTYKDEPLWEKRFTARDLKNMVRGVYAQAGQIQQRPSPRGGGFFVGDFKIINTKEDLPSKIVAQVRYWDKASSEGEGAYTSGVLMGLTQTNHVAVLDVIRGQWAKPRREKIIRETAESDGYEVETYVEQEPGGGGKESAQDTIRNLIGFIVHADRVTGDKTTRAEPYGIQQLEGNVYVLDRPWTHQFIDEHESFPMGRYKDMVDSASGAFNMLSSKAVVRGTW